MKAYREFEDYLAEQFSDPEFREEWEKDADEFAAQLALVKARTERHMSQSELARRSGVDQRIISRIELGESIPNVRTLRKLAAGLNARLVIAFDTSAKDTAEA